MKRHLIFNYLYKTKFKNNINFDNYDEERVNNICANINNQQSDDSIVLLNSINEQLNKETDEISLEVIQCFDSSLYKNNETFK